jgi:hypothetical protein
MRLDFWGFFCYTASIELLFQYPSPATETTPCDKIERQPGFPEALGATLPFSVVA